MMRMAAVTALLFLLAPSALFAQTPAASGTWAFQPARDQFRPDALLDLRSLNENVAGESGFVGVDANGDFVLGNGDPVRFWAVNTNAGREKPYVRQAALVGDGAGPGASRPVPGEARREHDPVARAPVARAQGQTDRLQPVRARLDLAGGRGHEERGHLRDDLAVLGRRVRNGRPGLGHSRRDEGGECPSGCCSSTRRCSKATRPG